MKEFRPEKMAAWRCLIGWFALQVETIGDAYMVVGGVPERSADHAVRVARFAIDIVGQSARVASPATGTPLQVGQPFFKCGRCEEFLN